MNKNAILHIPDSNFCYAVDEHTVEVFLRTDREDDFDEVNIIYGNKYDYYQKRVKAKMEKRFEDGSFSHYFIRLSLSDTRFVYIFELISGGETTYFCEEGAVEKYDFSVAYFNSFQLPYINRADVMPTVEWLTNAVFYQIFVDRFCCGEGEKDFSYVNLKWGKIPTPKSFAGGDLKGIISKLDYIKSLGVTALYLTPVFKSKSNHKYDISDYYSVDRQFGTNDDLKRLVQDAHKLGIRVVLDAVFNHCSDELKEFQDVVKNGKSSPYYDWFLIDGDRADVKKGNYAYFGVCKYMPKLNTSNISLQNRLIDVALHWIRNYDIDGWRLDVSDEVSHDFWRKLRLAVKEAKSDAVLIGENWHDASPYLKGDEYDSIMNYALTKAAYDYFVNGSLNSRGFAQRLSALYVRNKKQVNHMMLNLLDSHDTHRFYSLVEGNADKLITALAIIFCHTGSACVYYGTEVPLYGGYDPDCRRTMDWSCEKKPSVVGLAIKELAKIKRLDVLKYGEIYFESIGNKFILKRTYKDKTIRLTVAKEDAAVDGGNVIFAHNYSGGAIRGTGFVIQEVKA